MGGAIGAMTRREQIEQGAREVAAEKGYVALPPRKRNWFVAGAEWADKHPDKAAWLDKACKWLEREYEEIGVRWMRGDDAQDIVENFRKAMEL